MLHQPLVVTGERQPVAWQVQRIRVPAGVEGRRDPAAAVQALWDHCQAELAYFKAPGWLWLTGQIPTTSTQKVQKHQIFEPGIDPRRVPGMIDLRARKKRQ